MRAEDLRLEELVEFADGLLSLHGRRLVIHDMHAVAQFRAELLHTMGAEHARRLLTRFGYFWGQADAAAMRRIFTWESTREWLEAGPRLHALQGAARVHVKALAVNEAERSFHMEVAWEASSEAEEHLAVLGLSRRPVCATLIGYASGYASYCLGFPVYFIEQECHAQGHAACTAIGKDAAAWGRELEPHREYFKAEDVRAKIDQLSREIMRKNRELEKRQAQLDRFVRVAGKGFFDARSEAFRRVLDLAERVARFDTSVLVTGETGTGKEVLARHLHNLSPRSERPFVAVNCGALPETLLESELFGHVEGAFTGAARDRRGLFEEAEGGTILLDEIGETSLAMQVKLLRVLQEREILPVGSSTPRPVDVRVVAATNSDLDEGVANGTFREDLLYRLRVVEIEIPPLRARRDDIVPLARHFVRNVAERLGLEPLRLDASCLQALANYAWPGNVRELENAIERAAVFSRDGIILLACLPPAVVRGSQERPLAPGDASRSLADIEQAHVLAVLESVGGNRTRAAHTLGISPTTLWRKLKRYHADAPSRTGPRSRSR